MSGPLVQAGPAPSWRQQTPGEQRWPVGLTVLSAVGLQLALPGRLGLHPKVLLPALELAVLFALVVADPGRLERRHPALRYGGLVLIALVSLSNAISAGLLVEELLRESGSTGAAGPLLASGAAIYLTNIIAFGLWFWDFDRGGAAARAHAVHPHPDFAFPQMTSPDLAPADWKPHLVDYLYLSFTNATAFSPTDTVPLTRWAKILMALQSAVALTIVALVIARAVNILR